MKTLFLMRHAKSDWSSPAATDHDRPLNRQGEKAAPQMSLYMNAQKYEPEIVLCSSAERTQQTWTAMELNQPKPPTFKTVPALYHASSTKILETICSVEPEYSNALLIGHNPGMHEVASRLTGEMQLGSQSLSSISAFPTAALAVLTFDIDAWSEVDWANGTLIDFMAPKRLPKTAKN
jgi:phosphohistidine phosphatase